MWTIQLLNDSNNTRRYAYRCLTKVTGLSEDNSYQSMIQAHDDGEIVIGWYCQGHTEHYNKALRISDIVCEISPVEE